MNSCDITILKIIRRYPLKVRGETGKPAQCAYLPQPTHRLSFRFLLGITNEYRCLRLGRQLSGVDLDQRGVQHHEQK